MGAPSPIQTVDQTGAQAGDILVGIYDANHLLLLKIRQDQVRGHTGWIVGKFIVLDPGQEPNKWARFFQSLVHQETDARGLNDHVKRCVEAEGEKPPSHINAVNAMNLWKLDRKMIRT